MGVALDLEAVQAAFAQPACDGRFAPDFEAYLKDLGQSRPSIVLTFAPKAAGTYLRAACVTVTNGALVRTVHAQGGRDGTFYLPAFLNYFALGFPAKTLVTHTHIQALPATRHLIEALDLKPVIMMRSIPDMLTSYLDMLAADCISPDNWINLHVPAHFADMDKGEKTDFLVDMVAPWYVSYFSTWLDYASCVPGRVLVLDYQQFRADPARTLEEILTHSRLQRSRQECERALEVVWQARTDFRFNQGISGRGGACFSTSQIERLNRLFAFYPGLAPFKDTLIPPP